MKAIAIGAFIGVFLSGCSVLTPKVGPQVAKAVNRYCAEPYEARLLIRSEVNTMIKPNNIRVYCEGDPE
jgi:hypothetical protein